MGKTERVYKIEQLIRLRGHLSFRELQDELEVSPATLKRDLDYLRERLGAPIEYDRDVNGYRFGAGFRGERHELPGLWFSERELYALLMANQLLGELDSDAIIARHLQPLLDRIRQMLGGDAADADWLLERVKILSPAKRAVPGRFFELVGEALVKRRRVRMTYLTRGRGEVGERDISPQRLVHYRNTWYLDAWCHRVDALRRFALDAIEQAQVLDRRARDIAIKRVQAEMDAGYGIYAGGERQWALLRFDAQAAQWASREEWHPEQQGRWCSDGRWELRLPYVDDTELLMDVLRHGADVEVVAPAELRTKLQQRLRDAAAQYR